LSTLSIFSKTFCKNNFHTRKILILVFIFFLVVSNNPAYSQTKYSLNGIVFYDFNKNGIKDHNEFGIGGQYVILDGKSVSTALNGRYEFNFTKPLDFITNSIALELDDNHFLDEMIQTTPKQIKLSDIQDSMFGIYYPIKVMMMNPLHKKKIKIVSEFFSPPFELKGDLKSFVFAINETKLYIPKITLYLEKEDLFQNFSKESNLKVVLVQYSLSDFL